MATYNKINIFIADINNKVHNLGSDQLTIALTDSVPSAGNTILANISEIDYTNLSTRDITTVSSTQTGGTYKLVIQPLTLTASGSVSQFRYIVVYNNTSASDSLICWFDYGAEVNMNTGDTFAITFDVTNGLLQIQ